MGKKIKYNVRIKQAMNLHSITQTEIVGKTSIKKSALSQYLSGKIVSRQNVIKELSKVLNFLEP